jgi:hypothetical protein
VARAALPRLTWRCTVSWTASGTAGGSGARAARASGERVGSPCCARPGPGPRQRHDLRIGRRRAGRTGPGHRVPGGGVLGSRSRCRDRWCGRRRGSGRSSAGQCARERRERSRVFSLMHSW